MATVFLNDTFLPAEQAKVSVYDRGFLFGDGVYEVIPVYGRQPFRLKAHLSRLQNSLDGIHLSNPFDDAHWTQLITQLIEHNEGENQAVYLQVTRGVAPREHVFPQGVKPTVFMMSNPLNAVPSLYKTQGIKAITVDDIRWQRCDIKAIALLPNTMLRQQAHEQGAGEAILIRDGVMTEGSASNSYAVFDGVIYTAAKDNTVLSGITRDFVLELAAMTGIPVREESVTADRLTQADEIWISSSTRELLPVTTLDDKPVGQGLPGPIWQTVNELYQRHKLEMNV
ncbi:D-amino acid aminotransferase [Methylophaga marina]|uniref:D-alanine aminotransferase n=1 Tax=Methylophaga marina TaxID=45495 RepID=A0ABP3D799_9GAMM|nr:D-amino-acid transaminase [Methylophaga marina]BDZ74707.1 D-amino acid aminotransferase [Methylophaga marina]